MIGYFNLFFNLRNNFILYNLKGKWHALKLKCKKIFLICPKYISRSFFPRTTAFGRGGEGGLMGRTQRVIRRNHSPSPPLSPLIPGTFSFYTALERYVCLTIVRLVPAQYLPFSTSCFTRDSFTPSPVSPSSLSQASFLFPLSSFLFPLSSLSPHYLRILRCKNISSFVSFISPTLDFWLSPLIFLV